MVDSLKHMYGPFKAKGDALEGMEDLSSYYEAEARWLVQANI